MQLLPLSAAASLIKQECDQALGTRRPFFFVVGSGVSHPPVPLASEITDHCRREAQKYGRSAACLTELPIDQYSSWFQVAYPAPVARQQYLRSLIEGKPISEANLRLAHILLSHRIAATVVTPNFDDFLSRALTLFGVQHTLCDHPQTTERIDPDAQTDVQVVHVHGSYSFYDCCNLAGEVHARAQVGLDTNFTMAFLLDSILRAHAPIVVGYSGWESDVIMSALRRRLQSALPHNLYWCCYSESEIETLPDWLKEHRNVFIVVAERSVDERSTTAQSDEHAVLSAKQVFDEIIRTFSLEPPLLTRDPLAFLRDHLKQSLFGDVEEAADIYGIRSVVDRLDRAKRFEEEAQGGGTNRIQLERVRDALRTSAYDDAIAIASAVRIEQLEAEDLHALLELLTTAVAVSPFVEPLGLPYDTMMRVYNALREQDAIDVLDWQQRTAETLIAKARAVAGEDDHAAIVAYDEIYTRFRDITSNELTRVVAQALVGKASVQWYGLQDSDAEDTCDLVVDRYGNDLAFSFEVAKALEIRADMAFVKKDYARVLEIGADILRYGNAERADERWLALLNRAHLLRGQAFAEMDNTAAALSEMTVVVEFISREPHAFGREGTLRAFILYATLQERAHLVTDALATLDRAAAVLTDAKGGPNRQVARAWLAKAQLAERTGRAVEALAEYEGIIARVRSSRLRALKAVADQAEQALVRLSAPATPTPPPSPAAL